MNIMDLDSFLAEMDGDINDVKMIVSQFVTSIKDQIPLIEEYISVNNYSSITMEAHSIKGGARNIMAIDLELKAEALEFSSRAKEIETIKINFAKLKDSFEKLQDFALANYLI